MTLDSNTTKLLQNQSKRRAHWLSLTPPDRVEAQRCMRRVDDILDRRPKVYAVASDGEVVYSDAAPWIKGQLMLPGLSIATNTTDEPAAGDPAPGDPAPGGGVDVLERPQSRRAGETKPLPPITEADITAARKQLGL